MENELKTDLLEWCRSQGISLVGVADARRWENPPFQPWMPPEFYPRSIFPETESVIVIGLPVLLPIIETTPSIYYHEHYNTLNRLLDQFTYLIAERLNACGYPSVPIPRDGYGSIDVLREKPLAFFSHRHAAFLAGLGTFGMNNMILTPRYGPRVRFSSVFTAAPLPPDPLLQEDLCTRCRKCVEMCPSGALPDEMYPAGLTRKRACTDYSADLHRKYISPCGACIMVCPVGRDRDHFNRDARDLSLPEGKESPRGRARSHVQAYGGKSTSGEE
ncbi:MAG: 4Fe-4S binding protein [Methanolinea sp.]|nr:4Fe-4S binding protein [Methanolinea sp.]